MNKITNDPAYWLGRAKEMREIANNTSDGKMKEIMDEIANSYERIAEHVKKITGNGDSN
ncbi:MAG: hypothetical protein WBX25_20235 [Rhodomicrobium sp.]